MLDNVKVFVGKHSREIQEKAFALGWGWISSPIKEVKYLTAPFLYFDNINFMSYGDNVVDFNKNSFKELSAEEILAMEVPKSKTIRDLYPLSGFRVMEDGRITEVNNISPHCSYELWNTLPTKEEAEAYKILPMLLQYRDRYNEGWKPDWEEDEELKHCINFCNGRISKTECLTTKHMFAFKSRKIMNKFMEDFKEELEIVKPLL